MPTKNHIPWLERELQYRLHVYTDMYISRTCLCYNGIELS